MSTRVLGIDFGTSNTCACTIDETGHPVPIKFSDGGSLLPSEICFTPNSEIIIGKEARNLRVAYPEDYICEIKRQAGKTDPDGRPIVFYVDKKSKSWTGEELAALIFAKVKKDAEASCGASFETVLITVPACFDQAQRQFVINAGKIAGFNNVNIMDEPTAAAFAYGISKVSGTYADSDLGGGTYDMTIMSVDPQGNVKAIATGGKPDLGGTDCDMVIINRVVKEAESIKIEKSVLEEPAVRQEIKDRAQNLKHTLSVMREAQFNMFLGGKRLTFTYTREEFERDCRPLMDQMIAVTEEVFKSISLTPRDIKELFLVGGAMRMPMAEDRLTQLMGKPPKRDADPDMIVAKGAALTLAKILQNAGEKLLSYTGAPVRRLPGGKIINCAAHDLGCKAYEPSGTHAEFVPIIRKNTELPARCSETFALKDEGQTAVTVSVYQGEEGKPLSECCHIDDVNLAGLPLDEPHKPRICVEYAYSEGGLVDVKVTDMVSRKVATAQISHILGMNEQDIKEGGKAVNEASIR